MSEPAIKIRGIGKEYRLGAHQKKGITFREMLAGAGGAAVRSLKSLSSGESRKRESFWALKDVTFDVPTGEVVGLIGRNGAGKSTLLKVLSRITEPTDGYIDIRGRVGSLLEVGTGFHPELTGRENTYLNGAILGMARSEITRRFDEIVAFSEVEKFIDTPVKHYSSGMYLRLAFAVAAHLETEVLLVDEVLAVGDAVFQRKCMGKMSEVATAGRTVILVSHNMLSIARLCSQAVLLAGGQVTEMGPARDVIDRYMRESIDNAGAVHLNGKSRKGFSLESAEMHDRTGQAITVARSGDDLELILRYKSEGASSLPGVRIWIGVKDASGTPLFVFNSQHASAEPVVLQSEGVMRVHIPRLPLIAGTYVLSIQCTSEKEKIYENDDCLVLEVAQGDFYGTGVTPSGRHGSLLVPHEWSFEADEDIQMRNLELAQPVAAW